MALYTLVSLVVMEVSAEFFAYDIVQCLPCVSHVWSIRPSDSRISAVVRSNTSTTLADTQPEVCVSERIMLIVVALMKVMRAASISVPD